MTLMLWQFNIIFIIKTRETQHSLSADPTVGLSIDLIILLYILIDHEILPIKI